MGSTVSTGTAGAGGEEERGRNRFAVLLVSLLAVLALGPFLDGPLAHFLLNSYFSFVLLSALFSLRDDRILFRIGLVTAAPAMLMMWIAERFHAASTFPVACLLTAVFLSVTSIGLVRRAIAPGRVQMSRILASLSAYLMFGLVWAQLYAALAVLSPGSFDAPRDWATMDGGELLTNTIYFSYVTLTTLGYGDVTPTTDAARSLAVTEAICGQLYLTVMVARLVALYVAHEPGDEIQSGSD